MIRKMEYAVEAFIKYNDWKWIKWVDKNNAGGYY